MVRLHRNVGDLGHGTMGTRLHLDALCLVARHLWSGARQVAHLHAVRLQTSRLLRVWKCTPNPARPIVVPLCKQRNTTDTLCWVGSKGPIRTRSYSYSYRGRGRGKPDGLELGLVPARLGQPQSERFRHRRRDSRRSLGYCWCRCRCRCGRQLGQGLVIVHTTNPSTAQLVFIYFFGSLSLSLFRLILYLAHCIATSFRALF